jgi:hypothetical protein
LKISSLHSSVPVLAWSFEIVDGCAWAAGWVETTVSGALGSLMMIKKKSCDLNLVYRERLGSENFDEEELGDRNARERKAWGPSKPYTDQQAHRIRFQELEPQRSSRSDQWQSKIKRRLISTP